MNKIILPSEDLLNQLSGFILWKDKDSRYLAAGKDLVQQLLGYQNVADIVGLSDEDARCPAALCADEFRRQDKKVMVERKPMQILDIHPYVNDSKVMLTEKRPLYDTDDFVAGIIATGFAVCPERFLTIYQQLFKLEEPYKNKQQRASFSKELVDTFDFADLSEKETQVLSYLVYGYSARDIADMFKRSPRTIETHISHIKDKLGVTKKSDLIMFCIENGFLNVLPRSILSPTVNVSLEISIN